MTLTGKAAKKKQGTSRGEEIDIYRRAAESPVDDYLVVNSRPEPERVERTLADAAARRQRRSAKRKPKVFVLDLREVQTDGEV